LARELEAKRRSGVRRLDVLSAQVGFTRPTGGGTILPSSTAKRRSGVRRLDVLSAQVGFTRPTDGGTILPSSTRDPEAGVRDPRAGPGVVDGSNGLEVTMRP